MPVFFSNSRLFTNKLPYIPPAKEGVFAHYGQKGPFFNFVSRGARNVVSVVSVIWVVGVVVVVVVWTQSPARHYAKHSIVGIDP